MEFSKRQLLTWQKNILCRMKFPSLIPNFRRFFYFQNCELLPRKTSGLCSEEFNFRFFRIFDNELLLFYFIFFFASFILHIKKKLKTEYCWGVPQKYQFVLKKDFVVMTLVWKLWQKSFVKKINRLTDSLIIYSMIF